ncbi:MAG: ligase-associated DNA damage response DEXH box helicase [Pseudomonadota bacterium]
MLDTPPLAPADLPDRFTDWFARRGWKPRAHQLELLTRVRGGRSVLLIAPTGAGKTLAGFLPSLVDLAERGKPKAGMAKAAGGLHTLYISPLKALAVDIARNLEQPVAEMELPVRLETRTGDTPGHKRQRQRRDPPDILLTTPEQVALLIANTDAERFFADLRTVVLDELHSTVTSKRGDLLALALARLRMLQPDLVTVGLSATVAEPDELRAYLVPQTSAVETDSKSEQPRALADLVTVPGGAEAALTILESEERLPWSGHTARYAYGEIYEAIKAHTMTLVFVNTRSQSELIFQELWRINEDTLPIALHHGSLDASQRRKVEAAMAEGRLRAVVCTSTLDLGIDWGDVDLVVNVGAPKGASRLAQRIGRANHRMDEPSKALLVPSNRFEVLECRAALEAARAGEQDTPPLRTGALDVLAQHVLGMAVAAPFADDDLYREITATATYRHLTRQTFDRVVSFVATGGYALKNYDRYARIRRRKDGLWRVSNPQVAQQYRLNVGTIVEMPFLKVRLGRRAGGRGPLRAGPVLGQVEEYFLETLTPGDTFLFAGQVLKLEGIQDQDAIVSKASAVDPKVPSYAGGKFPLSTYLADRVRAMLADQKRWAALPEQVRFWLGVQRIRSVLPRRDELLVETFPRGPKFYMVCYPFEGRLAHQTLGMLLTRRLERARARPLGFVATEYAMAIWGLRDVGLMLEQQDPGIGALFAEDMMGDDLEEWMADSYLLKRTFRTCAVISGLIEQRHPGKEKTGRQMTVSSDLIYDVLREHEPDHILMQATWADASTGLLDVKRLSDMLSRVRGRIVHKRLDRISPLAVPIMMEIGREPVVGEAQEDIMQEAADAMIDEAMTLV